MKKNILYLLIAIIAFGSCEKKDNPEPNPPAEDTYINATAGSTWKYHETNSSSGTAQESEYTVTSSSKDTTINSRSYHIYNYSYGGSQYLNISGHEYYQYDSISGGLGQIFERLYLKDNVAVGTNWTQNISVSVPGLPFSVPVTITNTIAEKGIAKTVNGNNYTDVIHVSTSITSTSIPTGLTSDIHSYYAKKYGLIESSAIVSLNFLGVVQNINVVTKLNSATLK
ncbi:MAG TPA: hypothetical protein VIQ23_03780 [Hanamia sp.]